MGNEAHEKQAARLPGAAVAVVTVSDTRTPETDESGRLMQQMIQSAGHTVSAYVLVPNEAPRIASTLATLLDSPAQALFFSGGTGLGRRDLTYDLVVPRLEKCLDGFGELFRWLSYKEIGPAAMMSRAVAGAIQGKLVVCLPGSPGAVRLALEKLLLPQLKHILWELQRA